MCVPCLRGRNHQQLPSWCWNDVTISSRQLLAPGSLHGHGFMPLFLTFVLSPWLCLLGEVPFRATLPATGEDATREDLLPSLPS